MLENSVFSPHTCSWCLSSECNGTHCYPPDDPVYFTETNNIFCEEILPTSGEECQLELPLDSADPLISYQFHYEDSGWGQQWDSNFNYDEEQPDDSWEYDTASGYLYEGTTKRDNAWTETTNEWSESAQSAPAWQDNYLPNGSAEIIDQGSSVRNTDTEDAAPELEFNEERIGLMIEENDVEPESGNASSSSMGEI
jgi:hypothetical protein